MSIHRVVRQFETKQVRGPNGLENEYKYTVPPTKRTEVVYDKVPPSKWGAFLRDTYWGRVPKVVGVGTAGSKRFPNDVIFFHIKEDGELCVTFYTRDELRGESKVLLSAEEQYVLNSADPAEAPPGIHDRPIQGIGYPPQPKPAKGPSHS
ncbi:hypothetical protein AX14_001398 [Amanita brunnescens Koide BX004]|nr:hypothetical protein AX14_001398 [Amanita brunnescens Koide BX004]